jgi:hypothetical protein
MSGRHPNLRKDPLEYKIERLEKELELTKRIIELEKQLAELQKAIRAPVCPFIPLIQPSTITPSKPLIKIKSYDFNFLNLLQP